MESAVGNLTVLDQEADELLDVLVALELKRIQVEHQLLSNYRNQREISQQIVASVAEE